MNRRLAFVFALALAMTVRAATDEPSLRELSGPELARELMEAAPAENSTLTGILRIRVHRKRSEIPMTVRTVAGGTGWQAIYQTSPGTNGPPPVKLVVTHNGTNANCYELDGKRISPADAAIPFSGTDFWLVDLGLEFLHWPEQRVIKKEFRRNCACTVLESVNPSAKPGDYSRVVSWIDQASGGIVQAEAYVGNKRLKYFAPKDFKKVNGRWQLQEMRIENLQTDSRTDLEFDLDSK